MVGIDPHNRVSKDVVIKAIEESVDIRFRKAGTKESNTDVITKQAIMKRIYNLEIVEAPILAERKI